MMQGKLYIDGKDAYNTFGLVLLSGLKSLIAYPSTKPVNQNDWQEFDGVEADLSSIALNKRDVTLKFAIRGDITRYLALIELLSGKSYHIFNFAEIGRTYNLRLLSSSNLDHLQRLGIVTLKFSDDFPLNYCQQGTILSNIAPSTDYLLDGVKLSDYGIRILKGTKAEIVNCAEVKPNLLRDIKSHSGVIYDDVAIRLKSKNVKLFCLMRAENIAQLWLNYDSLLYQLAHPGEHRLFVNELEQEFPCYYKSCNVVEFFYDGETWLKFTITLEFTRDFRIGSDSYLSTEQYTDLVITETNDNTISMNQ